MVNTDLNTDLATALATLTGSAGKPGPRCGVGAILEELDPLAREGLETAMAKPSVRSTAIALTLHAWGYQIKAPTIARHRRAGTPTGCSCPAAGASA